MAATAQEFTLAAMGFVLSWWGKLSIGGGEEVGIGSLSILHKNIMYNICHNTAFSSQPNFITSYYYKEVGSIYMRL